MIHSAHIIFSNFASQLFMIRYILFPFQWLWRSFFFINAIVTFFLFYPVFMVLLSREKWFPKVFRLKKVWAHFILFPAGVFYKIQYKKRLDKNLSYVICPNHTSYLDIMLIYISMPVYFHSLGKIELRKVPLFGKFFERMNIPVNRKSIKESHRAYLRAGYDIDKGISINLFPEGTIHHNGPRMGRFKNGPFRLAIEKQIPIVPVTFVNNWRLMPDDFYRRVGHPGIAKIVVHEPIDTKGMTEKDLDHLKHMVYEIISAPLEKAYPKYFVGDKKEVHLKSLSIEKKINNVGYEVPK
jgi:1-acyl-sn-glycerol-3-phosphate acyltransferase